MPAGTQNSAGGHPYETPGPAPWGLTVYDTALVVIGANYLARPGIDGMDAATGDALDSLERLIDLAQPGYTIT